ncbi:MAG: hypothetical protein A3K03_10330 [Bdellovibrionales bacterium RIFOXYD1_FULL_44_7]|nr:MAG: hypothetical protein A3K03_10330 [Bdellovibrionales bacterium RIFOXYD1_FULL_44_7]
MPADFAVYFRAAIERVPSGANPYDSFDLSPFKYSPGVLAILTFMPRSYVGSWFAFSSVSILCLTAALLLGSTYKTRKEVIALLIGIAISWKGFIETLDYGQIEFVILLFSVLAAWFASSRPFWSGFFAGFLPWIKLPWGFLALPFFIISYLRGGKRSSLAFLAGHFSAALFWGIIIPGLVFGLTKTYQFYLSWIDLLKVQPKELYLTDMNQSIWIAVSRWTGLSQLPSALLVLVIVVPLVILLIRRLISDSQSPLKPAFFWLSPWLLLNQMINPLAWRWGSVFVVGTAIAALEPKLLKGTSRRILIAVIFLFILAQMNPIVKLLGFDHWSYFHNHGLVTAYWLFLILLAL